MNACRCGRPQHVCRRHAMAHVGKIVPWRGCVLPLSDCKHFQMHLHSSVCYFANFAVRFWWWYNISRQSHTLNILTITLTHARTLTGTSMTLLLCPAKKERKSSLGPRKLREQQVTVCQACVRCCVRTTACGSNCSSQQLSNSRIPPPANYHPPITTHQLPPTNNHRLITHPLITTHQ
jgi:hypothetical protein